MFLATYLSQLSLKNIMGAPSDPAVTTKLPPSPVLSPTSEPKPYIVLAIGSPGSGKGELCRRIEVETRLTIEAEEKIVGEEDGTKAASSLGQGRDGTEERGAALPVPDMITSFIDNNARAQKIQLVSVDDTLRDLIGHETKDGKLVEMYVGDRKQLPEWLLIPIIQRTLETTEEGEKPKVILIDGFPKDVEHCETFEEEVSLIRLGEVVC